MSSAPEATSPKPLPDTFERFLTAVVLTRCLDTERPAFIDGGDIDGLIERLGQILRSAATAVTDVHREQSNALPRHKLRLVAAYVADHMEEPIRVSQLAALVSVSPFHFSRQFRAATGLAPHQYVLQCRMQHAARMLAETQAPARSIAMEVGCADQSHFISVFRRSFGCTPRDFRRSIQSRTGLLMPPKP
jgi:AraC family transcriptional regulator